MDSHGGGGGRGSPNSCLWEAVATQATVMSDELTPIFSEPEEGRLKGNPTLAQK